MKTTLMASEMADDPQQRASPTPEEPQAARAGHSEFVAKALNRPPRSPPATQSLNGHSHCDIDMDGDADCDGDDEGGGDSDGEGSASGYGSGERFPSRELSPCCLHERLALVQAMEALPPMPVTPPPYPPYVRSPQSYSPPLCLPVPAFSPSPCPSPLSLPPPSPSSSCSPLSLSPPPLSPCPSPVSSPPPPQSPTGSGSPWDDSDLSDDEQDDLMVGERHVDGG